jgi:hypothetical protein
MRRLRFARALGLVLASGALAAACAGAPRPAFTGGPLGFGPLTFQVPDLAAPSIDLPSLVANPDNVAQPSNQPAARIQAPAVERFRAAMQESMETTGRCHH